MTLELNTFVLGPLDNMTYLLTDSDSKVAIVIDPALQPEPLIEYIRAQALTLEKVWVTHAHFDHYYGLPVLQEAFPYLNEVYLNHQDLELWHGGGNARQFMGYYLAVPEPNHDLVPGTTLTWRGHEFTLLAVPGHSPGSIVIYSPELNCAFCGDTIFYHGMGRLDLPGSDPKLLAGCIRSQIFTLPDATRLLPGHGPETTVAEEKANNPFIRF
jgi:Zn-dependent hydrolases, including glyoxylases